MSDIVIKALWFLLAIIVLVPIHELGHFYAMRIFGVKVLRFSVGFGHRLFTWTDKRGTEFALSAIPLGGYVKPLDDRNEEVSSGDEQFTLNIKPPWQRIIIFIAGPAANFVLALVFFWFILLVKGTVSYSPVIGEVVPGSIAAQAKLVAGQEIISIDGEPTSTRRAVILHLLSRLGESGDITFIVQYPDSGLTYESRTQLDNWLRGVKSPEPIEGLGLSFYYSPIPKIIDAVIEGSAADRAGFATGDELLAADGQEIAGWRDWVDYVRARPGKTIDVEVLREGEIVALALIPELMTDASGKTFGRAGVSVAVPPLPEDMVRIHKYNPLSALAAGAEQVVDTAELNLMSLKKLILGEISTKNLSGPIGIAKVAASYAEAGFWQFLSFLAGLSVLLGVLNLLPIPVLDGGHVVFALIEWIKGSPVSQEVQVWSLNLGIVMLFGVMIIAFYNDILGP